MITVHKYPIRMFELFTILMPAGAEVIHVAMQNDEPFMWVRVDTNMKLRAYNFGVFGTGHDLNTNSDPHSPDYNPVALAPHLGSFMMQGGALVFHLFGGIYA